MAKNVTANIYFKQKLVMCLW